MTQMAQMVQMVQMVRLELLYKLVPPTRNRFKFKPPSWNRRLTISRLTIASRRLMHIEHASSRETIFLENHFAVWCSLMATDCILSLVGAALSCFSDKRALLPASALRFRVLFQLKVIIIILFPLFHFALFAWHPWSRRICALIRRYRTFYAHSAQSAQSASMFAAVAG